jgi:hypothetical protein
MLEAAGLAEVVQTDVTGAFLETARRWVSYASKFEVDLRSTLGDTLFDEQQADRRAMIAAIEEGLLSRALLEGTKPK